MPIIWYETCKHPNIWAFGKLETSLETNFETIDHESSFDVLVRYVIKIWDLEFQRFCQNQCPEYLIYIQSIHRTNPYAFIAFNMRELINSLSILKNLILKLARKYMVSKVMKKNLHFWNVFSKPIQKIISDSIVNFDHTIIMKKKIPIFSSIQTTQFESSPKFNFATMSPTDFLSRRYLDS